VRPIVSGASGQLGRLVAGLLGPGAILVTRTPDAVGPDARFGDFDEPESLAAAFAGGDRLLLISGTDLDQRAEQHQAAIRAAKEAGVHHVVYTSVLSPEPPNPAVVAPSHHATEEALRASGLAWTILRNSLYADYQVPEAARAVETGRLVHNRGDGRVAYVSREDCAAVAAAVLTGSGHEGRIYDVTGPEAFAATDLAALYGQLGECAVEAVGLDDEAFVASLVGVAGTDHLRYGAELVASFGRAIREGYFRSRSDTVERLTGQPPATLREVLLRAR
jgi:NAD(P)H dehydrogenase (quinone)